MKVVLLIGVIALAMLSQMGLCQDKSIKLLVSSEKYTFTSFFDGKEFQTEFTEKDVSKTPSWYPEREEPPISVNVALERSRKFLGKYVPNPAAWEIESIKYTAVGKEKWVYVIEFYLDSLSASNGRSANLAVILKMDGTLFEPKVTTLDKH